MNRKRKDRFSARAIAVATAIAIAACIVLLASCSSEGDNFLERMFDMEARSAKGAPPRTVDELKAAIAKYGKALDETVAANEKIAMYWRLLAVRYTDAKMYGEAYSAARKALDYYPDNSGLYYVVGVSASYMAKTASAELDGIPVGRDRWLATAEAAYLESVEIDPRNIRSWYGLAVLYSFELERYAEAVDAMERYLAIDTKDVDALFLHARSLYGAGRLQDAADAYGRIAGITKLAEKKALAEDNRKRILDELYGP